MEGNASPGSLGIEASLAGTLAKIEIPPRPVLLDKLMAEMQQDEPDFHRLAGLIRADVGMSASLIKTANAPIFGYRSKATTVREALAMLGLIHVLRTLAGFSLRQAVPETPELKLFWDTSARVANLSGWLVKQVCAKDGVRAEDAYTFGIFHDCGIPVLMYALAGYDKTYALACKEGLRPLTEIEAEHHTLNHALVGCALAQSWLLPQVHAQAILYHHDLAVLSGSTTDIQTGSRRLIALGHLAEMLEASATGASDHEWQRVGEACLAVLDISPDRVAELQAAAIGILKGME